MSQDNSFIIAKSKELIIPIEIPHFLVADEIYLPICDTEGSEFNDFINEVFKNKKYDLRDYYSNNFDFIELTRKLNINSFVAYHFSEYGMMTINTYQFTIVNNIVIVKSIWTNEEGIITPEIYLEYEENFEKNNSEILLNIKIDGFFIEQLKDFDIAESLYKKWGSSLNFSEIDKINNQKIEENRKKKLENERNEIEENRKNKLENERQESINLDDTLDDIPSNSFWGQIKRVLKF